MTGRGSRTNGPTALDRPAKKKTTHTQKANKSVVYRELTAANLKSKEPASEKTCILHMRETKVLPRRLISVFVLHCSDSIISSIFVTTQAGIGRTWSVSPTKLIPPLT